MGAETPSGLLGTMSPTAFGDKGVGWEGDGGRSQRRAQVLRWAKRNPIPKNSSRKTPGLGKGTRLISVTYMLEDRSLASSVLSDTHSGINAPITSNSFLCAGWTVCL